MKSSELEVTFGNTVNAITPDPTCTRNRCMYSYTGLFMRRSNPQHEAREAKGVF